MVSSKPKVAVLAGGIGTERDISIQSGKCVAEALKEAGFNVITADIRPDNLEILEELILFLYVKFMHICEKPVNQILN